MKMSQLCEASGVSVPSIKFYLREGLLPAGERTSATQAEYGPEHVERLRLIRALIDIGGLSVATAQRVLEAIDEAWTSAVDGHPPTIDQRANLRLAATHAAHTAVEVVRSAFTLAGGTAVRNDSPLARILRDANVVTQHLMVSPVTYEPVGRVLLGLPVELLDL